MIGELFARKVAGEAFVNFGKHGCIPREPLGDNAVVSIFVPLLEIGAFHGIVNHVEEKLVLEDLEEFPVAVTRGALGIGLVAPEEFAGNNGGALFEHGQMYDAVGWKSWVWRCTVSG